MPASIAVTQARILLPRILAAVLLVVMPARAGALTSLSAASHEAIAAPDSLVAAFGTNLASGTLSATVTPLPESLGGTSVTVVDSAGTVRNAGILFVSPNQVNYVVPAGVSSGTATVTIRNANGDVSQGPLAIRSVAPGLFAANSGGAGPAAADASGLIGGVQTPLPVIRFDQDYGRFLTAPLNIAAYSGGVTLTVYGTGIRGATTVTAKVGSQAVPVLAVHAFAGRPGLDEVDIQIPPSLANRGIAALRLTADGVPSNAVTIETLHYQYLNLDYETDTPTTPLPWHWILYGSGYDTALDTSIYHSGRRSLRATNVSAGESGYFEAYQHAPLENGLEAAKGKHMKFGGWVKTAGMTRGSAGLWLSVGGPDGASLSFDQVQCAAGTSDWQHCEIDRVIDPRATMAYFGVLHTGDGTAWFDDHRMEIDGVAFPEYRPFSEAPTGDQLSWLTKTAHAFATPDAGNGFDDLAWMKDLVGDAHIVGLGEGTHGTSEFFRMKHRMLEYLATNMGFNVFAIEASMPEAYRLNDYVLNGIGDPAALVTGMGFWTWDTQEVLDMVRWMRQFNASGKGRLQFTGFDMQSTSAAISNVLAFIQKADPSYAAAAAAVYSQAQAIYNTRRNGGSVSSATAAPVADAVREIWRHLEQNRSVYLTDFPATEIDWAIQNGRVVEQATRLAYKGSAWRDQCMAANIDWILAQNPGAKMVVWAHNLHITRNLYNGGFMGSYLARAHDTDYLPIAQQFHAGSYNAMNGSLVSNSAVPSFPGTLEYALHSTGMPRLALDLRTVATDDPASSWLLGDMTWRQIGSVANNGWTLTGTLTNDFDAVIFFDQTTPSILLE